MSRVTSTSIAEGSEQPFAAWAEQNDTHRGACLRLAHGLVRDEHMAEDVVQEAFAAVWKHRSRFDPARSSQRSWLLMMTHRRAVDRIRAEQRHRDERLARTERHLQNESGRASSTDPHEVVARDDVGKAVRAALLELPVLQRETLMLAHWGGYSQSEIARLMGCPLGTVKTRSVAGMRRLRLVLESAAALDWPVA